MGTTRSVQPVTSCAFCGGPMPPPSATGRPAVFCSGTCRKAAHEARRTGAPGAFEVKVVERVVVESHDLASCVTRVIASPAACRRVLQALSLIHISEPTRLGMISYAVFCLKKKYNVKEKILQ